MDQERLRGLGQSFSFVFYNTIMLCAVLASRFISGTFLCTRFWWQSMLEFLMECEEGESIAIHVRARKIHHIFMLSSNCQVSAVGI